MLITQLVKVYIDVCIHRIKHDYINKRCNRGNHKIEIDISAVEYGEKSNMMGKY